MKAGIFCQGGLEIGLGHLTRCLEIAKEFTRYKIDVDFFVNNNLICNRKIESKNFRYKTFSNQQEMPQLITSSKVDFLLSDCNEATRSVLLAICEKLPVINIAVQGESKWYAHVSYLHSPYMDSHKPEDAKGIIHAGPEYVPLGKQFTRLRHHRKAAGTMKKILISMGGGDAMGHTILAIRALNLIRELTFEVNVCLGVAYHDETNLQNELNLFPHKYLILKDVNDMASVMIDCDLALLSMGTTTYEACSLGLPSINLCPSPFHENLARIYQENGFLISIGMISEDTVNQLAQQIRILSGSTEMRDVMSKRAQKYVDGQGIQKITKHILNAHNTNWHFD